MVLFGASGDLTSRKIFPALANLADNGRLSENFTVIGVARTVWDDEQFRQAALADVANAGPTWRALVERFRYVAGEYASQETFDRLKVLLAEADANYKTAGNRLYYLATVPEAFAMVAEALAKENCNVPGDGGSSHASSSRSLTGVTSRVRSHSTRRSTKRLMRTRSSG
jgi:glucose-6-phosphate 1-dehydrogenase